MTPRRLVQVSMKLAALRRAINYHHFTWLRDRAAPMLLLTIIHKIGGTRLLPDPQRPPIMRRL